MELHRKHTLILSIPAAPGQGEGQRAVLEVYARTTRTSKKHRLGKARLILTWADWPSYAAVSAALKAGFKIEYPAGTSVLLKKADAWNKEYEKLKSAGLEATKTRPIIDCQIVGVTLDPRAKIPPPKKTRPRRWGESPVGKTRSPKYKNGVVIKL